jgi:hypothetical protein
VRKYRYGALMFGFARVRVQPSVKLGRGGHCIQQQDHPGQQRGDDCLAGWSELARY